MVVVARRTSITTATPPARRSGATNEGDRWTCSCREDMLPFGGAWAQWLLGGEQRDARDPVGRHLEADAKGTVDVEFDVAASRQVHVLVIHTALVVVDARQLAQPVADRDATVGSVR